MDTSNRPKSSSQRRAAAPKTHETKTATKRPALPSARARSKPADTTGPTHQQIAERAYLIHLSRGSHQGSPHEDWLQAERELTAAARPAASPRKRTPRG